MNELNRELKFHFQLPTGVNTKDETGIISSSNLAIVQTTENEKIDLERDTIMYKKEITSLKQMKQQIQLLQSQRKMYLKLKILK